MSKKEALLLTKRIFKNQCALYGAQMRSTRAVDPSKKAKPSLIKIPTLQWRAVHFRQA